MQVFDYRFQAESGLTQLGNGSQKPAENLPMPNVR